MNNEIRHDPDGGFTVLPLAKGVGDTGGKITIDIYVLESLDGQLYDDHDRVHSELRRLREALAQPQQEPVAEVETVWLDKSKATVIVMHGRFLQRGDKLYASPARKPLTVEQIKNCLDAADQMYCERDGDKEVFKARAIEAAAHGIEK